MSLTAADVAEIMRLVEQSGFDELNLEMDGTKISLRRGVAGGRRRSRGDAAVPAPARRRQPPTPRQRRRAAAPARRSGCARGHRIAPARHLLPRAQARRRRLRGGRRAVEEDTIVGIIEVMKLMNTVRAGVRGTVTEILAADGALVEFGETLLRVRKSG